MRVPGGGTILNYSTVINPGIQDIIHRLSNVYLNSHHKSCGGDYKAQDMTVNDRFTKLERKELKRLVGLAYERELAKSLESLGGDFKQWIN